MGEIVHILAQVCKVLNAGGWQLPMHPQTWPCIERCYHWEVCEERYIDTLGIKGSYISQQLCVVYVVLKLEEKRHTL